MVGWLKRLLWDQAYASQQARAAIGFIGMLVVAGVIEVPVIPETVGGWYAQKIIGAAMAGCAWYVKAGQRNAVLTPREVERVAEKVVEQVDATAAADASAAAEAACEADKARQ